MIEILDCRDMSEEEKKEYLSHNEEVRKLDTNKKYISIESIEKLKYECR